jgi:hypothetical protein
MISYRPFARRRAKESVSILRLRKSELYDRYGEQYKTFQNRVHRNAAVARGMFLERMRGPEHQSKNYLI